MKVSEMTARQRKAFYNIKYAANHLLGGLENTLLDYPEDSDEYKRARAFLNNHNALVRELYNMATSAVYEEDCCWFGKHAEMFIKDINFCGRKWLMERCDSRITRERY